MPSTRHPPPATRWTDSPWFWLFVFGGMGLVALATISPKFARRQERLQRMYEARQGVAASASASHAGDSESVRPRDPPGRPVAERTGQSELALWPLMLFLAVLLFVAALVMVGRRMARGP